MTIRVGLVGFAVPSAYSYVSVTSRAKPPTGPPKDGVLLHQAEAAVDLVRWITGLDVQRIYVEASSVFTRGGVTEDEALLTMDLDRGAFATIDANWSRPASYPSWGDLTADVFGSSASYRIDLSCQNLVLTSDGDLGHAAVGWGDDLNELLIRAFVSAVEGEEPCASTADAVRALEIIDAAARSIELAEPIYCNSRP